MRDFGWDLPPGVTGREWQIAGPIQEGTARRVCERCSFVKEYNGWYDETVRKWFVMSEDNEPVCVDDCDISEFELPVFTNQTASYWGNGFATYCCDDCDLETEEDAP